MLAVPIFSGAMENWGLIMFREDWLLHDPERSLIESKQLVAKYVSHELAHQVCHLYICYNFYLFIYLLILLLVPKQKLQMKHKCI